MITLKAIRVVLYCWVAVHPAQSKNTAYVSTCALRYLPCLRSPRRSSRRVPSINLLINPSMIGLLNTQLPPRIDPLLLTQIILSFNILRRVSKPLRASQHPQCWLGAMLVREVKCFTCKIYLSSPPRLTKRCPATSDTEPRTLEVRYPRLVLQGVSPVPSPIRSAEVKNFQH